MVWLGARGIGGEGGSSCVSTEPGNNLLGPRYVCGLTKGLGRNAFGRCRWFVTVGWAINKRILVIGVGPSEAGPDQGPLQGPHPTTLPNGASSTTSLMTPRVSLMAASASLMAARASLVAARASLVAAMAARMTPTST